jgi:hypothetical protein
MSNLGWTEFDILNANQLYVNGQPFTAYISNLIAEDNLEQVEIDEIKAFLARLDLQITAPNTLTITNDNRNSVLKTALDLLNTRLQYFDGSALTQSWILNDLNRNATLKTAIDLINSRLLYIDTTGLTEISNLNNDNRNSLLKTSIDNLTSSVGTNNGKLRYVSSTQGTNNPDTFSEFGVNVSDRNLTKIILQTANGSNLFGMLNNASTIQNDDFPNNRILLNSTGRIELDCKNLQLQSQTIEIGADFAIGGESEIRLGTKKANIKIGSHQSPDLNEPTIITIGKRTATQNTHTYMSILYQPLVYQATCIRICGV